MEFFDTVVTEQAKQNVMEVLNSGFLSEGEWVKRFEKELETQFGYRNCVAVNSGTSALHLALVLAGVRQGDEVILPAQTFVATGLAVLYCGAKPVFADIGMDGNISVDSVSSKITSKTKAVIAVAWGGLSPDLKSLREICNKAKADLIVDNAHALGAKVEYEDYSCFSFQSIKQLTTGDGGLLVGRSMWDYHSAKRARWFWISREHDLPDETGEREYNLHYPGYKYHMNNVAAAIGLGNLDGFKKRENHRYKIALNYERYLELDEYPYMEHNNKFWIYTILVERRNDFIRAMKSRCVPTSVVHVGIDRNDIFGGKVMENVNQRYWDEHHVCLPIHSRMTDEDVAQVISAVKAGW